MTNTNTYKGVSIALGVGLAILWIAGLSSPYAPAWLTWLDGVAALCAFVIAGSNEVYDTRQKRMVGPITLSSGLFGLWIIALATSTVAWMSWWTFAFACAFLIFGVTAGGARTLPEGEIDRTGVEGPSQMPRQDRFRRTG